MTQLRKLMFVLVIVLLPQASLAQSPKAERLALTKSVMKFAHRHFAAFGDVEPFISFYDHSSDFSDFELGALKDWPMHESDIKNFFRSARDLSASREGVPKIVILDRSSALIVGIARFNFTTGGMDGSSTTDRPLPMW